MSTNRPFTLERLRFWQGQKLLGRDFRDQLARESQLRWWHNRAMHNAFGVSFGFEVSPVVDAGKLVAVLVTCGVAYDCFGRELLLQNTREINLPSDVPEKNRKITLVASYKEGRRCGNECVPVCACRTDEPQLEWKLSHLLELSDGVPLAEVSYDPAAESGERVPVLNANFSAHHARALSRPRIGRGATVPGNTSWEPWNEILAGIRAAKFEIPLGVQVTIDTSSAGFTDVPCYFAWLQGSLWNKTNIEFFPVPFSHIDNETPQQFRFRVWLPPVVTVLGARVRLANASPISRSVRRRARRSEPTGFSLNEFVNFARAQSLYVCWIGLQEHREHGLTCQPLEECECVTNEKEFNQQQSARK